MKLETWVALEVYDDKLRFNEGLNSAGKFTFLTRQGIIAAMARNGGDWEIVEETDDTILFRHKGRTCPVLFEKVFIPISDQSVEALRFQRGNPLKAEDAIAAIENIYQLLFLDNEGDRDFWNPDKQWNPGILDEIAEIVTKLKPRPNDERIAPLECEDQFNKNNNLLAGYHCPQCGEEETFVITTMTALTVTDDEITHENAEWDNESLCRCNACGYEAKAGDFQNG